MLLLHLAFGVLEVIETFSRIQRLISCYSFLYRLYDSGSPVRNVFLHVVFKHFSSLALVGFWCLTSLRFHFLQCQMFPALVCKCLVRNEYDLYKYLNILQVSPHKRGIRNGPKALKPIPVIIRCR